jgi:tetratricopeptide (TPR) repeat protein
LPYFQKALEYGEGNLPHERVQALRYNVAALLYQVGKTDESIKLLKDWLKKSNVEDDKVLILLSVIYAQRNQYKEAICPAYFAIKAADKPKKDYYSVLMSAHYELGDMKGTAVILRELVEKFPQEANFWRQLSSLYLQLDRMEDSLIIQDLLYIQGKFEKENDYKSLSSLFAYAELPYQAAEILKEGMEKGVVEKTEANWRNVAQNYQAANEVDKAIEAWGKTAELSKDGKAYERQAQLYNEKDEWRKAISALNKALAKGNIDNPGLAYMNKGIAEINLKQCTQGIKTLRQASKYKSVRKQAVAWIGYAEQRVKQQKCQ